MKTDWWWQNVLSEWSVNAGHEVEIVPYSQLQKQRVFGEWWLNSGSWNLHLESRFYARFNPNPDVTLRRTLTWMLCLLRQSRRPSPEVFLTSWVEDLVNLSVQDLDKAVAGGELPPLSGMDWVEDYGRGWFALISPIYPRTVMASERLELRQQVGEVATSFLGNGFVGWINLEGPGEEALVFIEDGVLEEGEGIWDLPPGEPCDDELPKARRNLRLLRRILGSLLDSLRQDVLVTAQVVVGARLDSTSGLVHSLLTAALLQHKRHLFPGVHGISIWEENPLNILLQSLPAAGVRWFLNAAALDAPPLSPANLEAALSEELVVSLQSLISANLNVSEAARLLFVHRNTLIHRLDRITELTGYDVRNFQDALTLWLSLKLRAQATADTAQSDKAPHPTHP